MRHNLKISSRYFDAVTSGSKTFEIRYNDRSFCVGDEVLLREFEQGNYTGREYEARIAYITDYEQKPGFVVFSLINGRYLDDDRTA